MNRNSNVTSGALWQTDRQRRTTVQTLKPSVFKTPRLCEFLTDRQQGLDNPKDDVTLLSPQTLDQYLVVCSTLSTVFSNTSSVFSTLSSICSSIFSTFLVTDVPLCLRVVQLIVLIRSLGQKIFQDVQFSV